MKLSKMVYLKLQREKIEDLPAAASAAIVISPLRPNQVRLQRHNNDNLLLLIHPNLLN